MATKIVTKNSSTASAVPTASDLVQGELAVNVADKRLFTEDNGGAIVELGTKPSTIDINAGSIDGTAIGASSASTGAFTTLTATGLTVDTDTLAVDSTNNRVGIGTSSPSGKLHLSGDGDSASKLTVQRTGASAGTAVLGYNYVGSFSNNEFKFFTNSAERMRINSSGNVGIGTSSPQTSLAVETSGTQNVISPIVTGQTSGVTYGGLYTVRDGSGDQRGLDLKVYTANVGLNTAMRIDSSGRVSVGTKAWITADANVGYFGGNSGQSNHISFYDSLNLCRIYTNGSERLRIDSSGNLLVGTTSGADKLNVYQAAGGTISTFESAGTQGAWALRFKNPNGNVGNIAISGTTTSYNTSSDQRLKENIADADDAGSKIDAIQVRKYDWKADGSHQDYGMIAQELLEVAPEAVSVPEDSEEMMGVDYSKLVPMLVKEIQSLRNRVEQLEQ